MQEHGQSLSMVAHALRRRGADVTVVTVYRVAGADDPEPMFELIDLIADRALDAVTFTSAPAVAALMDAAGPTGRRDDVIAAFQADVVASCVGPVTAAAFELWGVPTVFPDRSRLVAMVKQLETELPSRRYGLSLVLAGGQQLLLHGRRRAPRRRRGQALPGAAGRPPGPGDQPGQRRLPQGPARAAAQRHRRAPSTPSRWRSPGSAPPSAPGPCRPSSSAATGSPLPRDSPGCRCGVSREWLQTWLQRRHGEGPPPAFPQVRGPIRTPSGTRTPNPLIKSQLLCQLS